MSTQRLRLSDILRSSGASCDVKFRDRMVKGVSTDSRTLKKGEFFVAIEGDRFNGTDYLDDVCAKAAGALVPANCRWKSKKFPLLYCDDTVQAMGRVARDWRRKFQVPMIAVTGSTGKSTTKEWIAHLLAADRSVLKSPASYNNAIGLPLTLLKLSEEHSIAVVELGTNRPGEIKELVGICEPTIASPPSP